MLPELLGLRFEVAELEFIHPSPTPDMVFAWPEENIVVAPHLSVIVFDIVRVNHRLLRLMLHRLQVHLLLEIVVPVQLRGRQDMPDFLKRLLSTVAGSSSALLRRSPRNIICSIHIGARCAFNDSLQTVFLRVHLRIVLRLNFSDLSALHQKIIVQAHPRLTLLF